MKIPVINESVPTINKIFEFLRPEYLNISISWFSNNFMKNNCIVNSKINGDI